MIYSHPHTKAWHPYMSHRYSHPSSCYTRNFGSRLSMADPCEEIGSFPGASSSIMILTQSICPTVTEVLSNAVAVITSFVASVASTLLQVSVKFQDLGETLLTAFFILSFLQAAVAMYQYRYDVRGQLIFPDGPTVGVENTNESMNNGVYTESSYNTSKTKYGRIDADSSDDKENVSDITPRDDIYGVPYFLRKLNKSLLLLLPWITGNMHSLLTKNSHLFHIGFIITMVRFLEDTMFGKDDGDFQSSYTTTDDINKNSIPTLIKKVLHPEQNKDPIRIVVIGDSLAVGIGCIEVFDSTKTNESPYRLVENTAPVIEHDTKNNLQAPVFPQILARTLSSQFNRPVHWRSGGVDGGDVNNIRKFCMDIIRQEADSSNNGNGARIGPLYVSGTPDIIVVLFGMNDLKNLVSLNMIPQMFRRDKNVDGGSGIAHHFRRGMEALIGEIQLYAPNAYIVFPQLPIQTFHKNSIVNIVPLGVFVDTMMGFWEGQKRRVMEGTRRGKNSVSERNTMYIDLNPKEIACWYCVDKANDGGASTSKYYEHVRDDILISADGVHPNKKMYARWGESVGKKIYQRIEPQLDFVKQKH